MSADLYHGQRIHAGDLISYTAIKTAILKTDFYHPETGVKSRLSLAELLNKDRWWDDAHIDSVFWDSSNHLYNLKNDIDLSLPANQVPLSLANIDTFFDKVSGGDPAVATPTDLALGTATATSQPIANSNGLGFTLPSATNTTAGLLSSADKVILDGLATGVGESSIKGDGVSPAIPTANLANWKLNTIYIFNIAGTLATPLILEDGSSLTAFEAGSSLKLVKTATGYGYVLNDANDSASLAGQDVITPTAYATLAAQVTATTANQVTQNTDTNDVVIKDANNDTIQIVDRSIIAIGTAITSAATITATTRPTLILVAGAVANYDITLPLANTQKYPLYISRSDYDPAKLVSLKAQATDKIMNIATTNSYPLSTGTSSSDTYMLIPTTIGWVIN